MTKKSDLFFMSCQYGILSYQNMYSFYDEPRIFTALNENEHLYFCYWLGCDDTNERWLITPISEKKVIRFEQKDIPLISAIIQSKSSKVLIVRESLDTEEQSEELVKASSIPFKLPDDSVFIQENINLDGKRKHTHKIRVSKKNGNPIMSEMLNEVTGAFTSFFRNFLKSYDISSNFYSIDAVRGSFMYRVKAENIPELRKGGYPLLKRIPNKEQFLELIESRDVDLRTVRKLFDTQLNHDLELEFIDEETTESVFKLSTDFIRDIVTEIDEKLNTYLDSTMVPQADNLDTLRRYLLLLDKNGIVTSTDLKFVERQIGYYRGACNTLSLTHPYGKLTPLGQRALEANNEAEFVKIIQRQFEETECGSIWMANQGVTSILDIDEKSAVDFLINNCNGLSENTSRRRAQTLISWVKKFKKFKE